MTVLLSAAHDCEGGRRGSSAARDLNVGFAQLWDRDVATPEGRPWDLQERLVRSGDLGTVYSEQTVRAALRLLHELCPDLYVRVNRAEYAVVFDDLRAVGARVTRLEVWCRATDAELRKRELSLKGRDNRTPRLSRYREALHSRLRRYRRASKNSHGRPQISDRVAAAREELARLGPAVQGQSGDKRTFVAAAIGGDYGLSREEFYPLLEEWNEGCDPKWPGKDLERKLGSAERNRKRPHAYRLANADVVAPEPTVARDKNCKIWERATRNVGVIEYWARGRGLDGAKLAERDLVRVLDEVSETPECRIGRTSWSRAGYGVLLAVYDADGQVRSVRARPVDLHQTAAVLGPNPPKEVNPTRSSPTGLFFADPRARLMLEGVGPGPAELWIAEGAPDFLTLCQVFAGRDVGVIGVFAGSWTKELADKIPDGTHVVIATHADHAGRSYASTIVASLGDRVRISQWQRQEDINQTFQDGQWSEALVDSSKRNVARPVRGADDVTRPVCDGPVDTARSKWQQFVNARLREMTTAWDGTARELARWIVLSSKAPCTPGAVRGVERAVRRLAALGELPSHVTLQPAWTSPFDSRQGQSPPTTPSDGSGPEA